MMKVKLTILDIILILFYRWHGDEALRISGGDENRSVGKRFAV